MKRFTGLVVVALMAACTTPQNAEPEILPAVAAEKEADKSGPDSYAIRINFVCFENETSKAPKTAAAFERALQTWSKSLPIECAIFKEKGGLFPLLPFGPDAVSDERGMVRVHIVDVQKGPYSQSDKVLGYWTWTRNELFLDQDSLEADEDQAYAVALHELGHVFGLPHFANEKDTDASTGYYVIPKTYNAEKLVMFPISSSLNKRSSLTKLEISLARKNLLVLQQVGRTNCFHLTSR